MREHTSVCDRVSEQTNEAGKQKIKPDCLGLYGQVNKRIRWMPWQLEAMKDVVVCDKLRGVGKLTLIRRFPNGETHLFTGIAY